MRFLLDQDVYALTAKFLKQSTYENFFQLKAIKIVFQQNQLLLIVVDIESEMIVQWIN
ncbi:MAG: hypothetical protein KME40_06285 [Komarekiella atlantica HA4396-MV6]|jgi:hypothetical protein|nr:hypothetical protein [Komarekiella atlantica HA4396-MV6]